MKYILFIVLIAISAAFQFQTKPTSNEDYVYDVATQKLKPWEKDKPEVTPVHFRDSLRNKASFFTTDYHPVRTPFLWKGKLHIPTPERHGLLEVSAKQVTFLNPYNSLLSLTGSVRKIVTVSGNDWILAQDGTVFRMNARDSIKLSVSAQLTNLFTSPTGVWVTAEEGLYHFSPWKRISYLFPEKVHVWRETGNGTMTGYTDKGIYVVKEEKVTFAVKGTTEVYPRLLKELPYSHAPSLMYKGVLYIAEGRTNKLYQFSASPEKSIDLAIAQVAGISKTGKFWFTSMDETTRKYNLCYLKPGWEKMTAGSLPEKVVVMSLQSYNNNGEVFYINDNEEIFLIDPFRPVQIIKDGAVQIIPAADDSNVRSIADLKALPNGTFTPILYNELWQGYSINTMPVMEKDVVMGFNVTNKDSQHNTWNVDKGILSEWDRGPSKKYDIGRELARIEVTDAEPFDKRPALASVFVNKNDVIHIIGQQSIAKFDIKANVWSYHKVPGIRFPEQTITLYRMNQDSAGYLWFEVSRKGLYLFNGKEITFMGSLSDVRYWQMDADRQLTILKDGVLFRFDFSDLVPASPKVQPTNQRQVNVGEEQRPATFFEFTAGGSNAILESKKLTMIYPVEPWIGDGEPVVSVLWENMKPTVITSHGFYFYKQDVVFKENRN